MKEESNEGERARGFCFSFATVEVEVEFFSFLFCFRRLSTSSSVEERGKESVVEKKKTPIAAPKLIFSSFSLVEAPREERSNLPRG